MKIFRGQKWLLIHLGVKIKHKCSPDKLKLSSFHVMKNNMEWCKPSRLFNTAKCKTLTLQWLKVFVSSGTNFSFCYAQQKNKYMKAICETSAKTVYHSLIWRLERFDRVTTSMTVTATNIMNLIKTRFNNIMHQSWFTVNGK